MPTIQIAAPAAEPVSRTEAKLHLRVEHSNDDALIDGLILAARIQAEKLTGRQLVSAQWRLTLDAWPADEVFRMPYPPLISVQSVKYLDAAGTLQTMDAADYQADIAAEPGRLLPAYGKSWPAIRDDINAVRVEYTAGYANAAAVPQPIKAWMLLAIGTWYAQREALFDGPKGELPRAFWEGLLDPYRILVL